jgi:eukaryotic-like serine/threonine-protein kinase
MNSARWDQIQALFHEAVMVPSIERRNFLQTRCGDDPDLVAEVLALLVEDDPSGTFVLDRGVAHLARHVFNSSNLPPGLEFGPYRIQHAIGEGGMGVVYLAHREDLGAVVAIKILRDAWLSPARRERFASEQRVLAQLNHPSIARLYDADTLTDGTPWFAMEYVAGVPLTEYCASRRIGLRERLLLFRAVCEAVQHAHQHAVIHRDLKPSNILVKDDGTIRLLDFGIAKQMDGMNTPADLQRTRTALRLMTPAYAAPEQIRGDATGVFTDVYALGVILYELLAGELPFETSSRTPGELEASIIHGEPRKPSTLPSRVPARKAEWADLGVLCLTAMRREPERRYASADALMRDVDHFLNGEPLAARPDALGYRTSKFLRRNRAAVVAAASAGILIASLVLFFVVRLTIARNAAVAEAARTRRIQQFTLDLFQGGDRAVGPAENLQVKTLLERGVQEARALDAEPAAQAELYQTLGSIYQKLGEFDRAGSLMQSALEQRRKHFGAHSTEQAETLVAIGLLRVEQARLPEAESLVRQGLEDAQHTLPAARPSIAKATIALGKVLEARGSYAEAISTVQKAVDLEARAGSTEIERAEALAELANIHFYAGHLDRSEALNQQVLKTHRHSYGERHPLVAADLTNLGAIVAQGTG